MDRQIKDWGQEKLLKDITALLSSAEVPYMITGSLSVIFYGRPRASHDIDFVIEAKLKELDQIVDTFLTLSGSDFLVDTDLIRDALVKQTQFNVMHLPTMLKLDFWLLTTDLFDQERFDRRKMVELFGQKMFFSSPEDTILKKLLSYKSSKIEKHLIDAAFVYQLQEANLDKTYLKKWTTKQKTEDLLAELVKIDLSEYY